MQYGDEIPQALLADIPELDASWFTEVLGTEYFVGVGPPTAQSILNGWCDRTSQIGNDSNEVSALLTALLDARAPQFPEQSVLKENFGALVKGKDATLRQARPLLAALTSNLVPLGHEGHEAVDGNCLKPVGVTALFDAMLAQSTSLPGVVSAPALRYRRVNDRDLRPRDTPTTLSRVIEKGLHTATCSALESEIRFLPLLAADLCALLHTFEVGMTRTASLHFTMLFDRLCCLATGGRIWRSPGQRASSGHPP